MKFCKDCRFYSDLYCHSPKTATIDPVTGPRPSWAEHARRYECGLVDANHFEPRLSLFQKIKRKLAA